MTLSISTFEEWYKDYEWSGPALVNKDVLKDYMKVAYFKGYEQAKKDLEVNLAQGNVEEGGADPACLEELVKTLPNASEVAVSGNKIRYHLPDGRFLDILYKEGTEKTTSDILAWGISFSYVNTWLVG